MAGTVLEKGKSLYKNGQPMTALHLITAGAVNAEYPGGTYQLKKGDVIGICEICSEIHFLGYTATEDSTILTYPVNNMEALDDLLQKHPDVARVFMISLFRQINMLLSQSSISEMNCANLHQNLTEDYEKYTALCARYRVTPRSLDGLNEVSAYIVAEDPDIWLNSYYLGLQNIYSSKYANILIQEPGISLGMLRKGSLDFRKTYTLLDDQNHYCTQILQYYLNSSGNDLFDFYTSLYYQLGANSEDATSLCKDIERMITHFEGNPALDANQVTQRVESFRSRLSVVNKPELAADKNEDSLSASILSELAGSLNAILEFAGADFKDADTFRQHVNDYKKLEDKNAMDDVAGRLRKRLTAEFNSLYAVVFEQTLGTPYIPTPVKMFLYFGYVDEELAGASNCGVLYNLTFGIEDQSKFGVYTFYHWLLAIYNGDKSPSRNEFDEDYTDYLHKQKAQGNITASQLDSMEKDPMSRVKYELENMFASANKVTFGRISTFCPLFAAENVLKDLKGAFVTLTQISKALETIRSIDYSAFYRESMDFENMDIMGKEMIHLEFVPDVILAPNVGIRGVMWQEIEGKKRNSPGRMVFSIFHMEDLTTTMVRLAGEFRWEMCKRIQGSRWNDVSERSLTSEYFDYVQFYRKNHELSAEAKERVRVSLQRAKNSFKEMFVRDYIIWVLFEGNNSPRLNKVARKILFAYCPFPARLMTTLSQNPLYSELMERSQILASQRVHHLEVLAQKIRNNGAQVPSTLEAEIAYTQGKV
ncbi:MAG: Crp/Fnr family transcriptional regulator [Acetatifactor sp.]|nr:Crp/Fnr family transcriptional regulator [Acetatifactor sp.]